ncbi:hypothetical protein CLV67_103264 [Actinoplanes italicus]|uniref:Uncharacterized protein n=2 Tax=Actinoplanes italicus TaxID=113567 RepID=A0A2T0KJM0_9ACTN|nr:hypothetical protein CLV67_103264 [Actinoplanes italicus]
MLFFAVRVYVVSLVLSVGAVYVATRSIVRLCEDKRIGAILVRRDYRSGRVGDIRLVARAIAGGDRPFLASLTFLLVVICFTVAIAGPLSMAFQGIISDGLILPVCGVLGLVLSVVALVYIGSGGRKSGSILPAIDVRPLTIRHSIRIQFATAVIRFVLVGELIVLVAFLAGVATSPHISSRPGGELADPIELLYLVGIALMGMLAWLLRQLLFWTVPHLAAFRLLMQVTDRHAAQLAGAPVRDALMALCRLVSRYAVVISGREAVVRSQSPPAVVLRSVEGNLRTFLSNKRSVGVRLEDVRSDLIMVAAFLCHPTSVPLFEMIAARMQAFTDSGEPREKYRSETPARFVVFMNRFHSGLERTHQGFMRSLAIIAGIIVIFLLFTGAIKLPDIIKVVK